MITIIMLLQKKEEYKSRLCIKLGWSGAGVQGKRGSRERGWGEWTVRMAPGLSVANFAPYLLNPIFVLNIFWVKSSDYNFFIVNLIVNWLDQAWLSQAHYLSKTDLDRTTAKIGLPKNGLWSVCWLNPLDLGIVPWASIF